MRSTAPMRVAKTGYITVSAAMMLFGICLICMPVISAATIATVFGAVTAVFGVIKIIGYFSGDLFRLAFQYDLASGILFVLVGAALMLHPVDMLGVLCMLIGVLALADGLFKIQITIEAKRFGIDRWWLILCAALVAGILGFILILFPGAGIRTVVTMFGVIMLADGILNICTVITAVKIIKHQKPDIPEADFTERKD